MTDRLAQLFDDFALFDDWEERYRYLIDLGKHLPALTEAEHNEANKVEGCMSQVWMVADKQPDGTLVIRADSDAHVVRGLVALLLLVYSGLTPQQMAEVKIETIFDRLGLEQHLSPNRRNGFFAMVSRIKSFANIVQN